MMLCLHLFNRDYHGLFQPLIFIGKQPLSYYISLFSDACVPIFAFVSGYGLYFSYVNDRDLYTKKNIERTKYLYVRYWIILVLFVVVLGWLLDKDGYPGSWQKFILSLTGLEPGYNGAWWFFTIYILFVLSSNYWFKLLNKLNPFLYLGVLFICYLAAFYFRVYRPTIFDNSFFHWLHTQAALYFCTLFQFMLGAFALKYLWHNKVSMIFDKIKHRKIIVFLGILILIVFHGFVPNFIVAPFTALGFIFLFLQVKLKNLVNNMLDFFTPHATNIWLVHMFFYMIYFKEFVYSFSNVLLIFFVLLSLSLVSSYVINFLNTKVHQQL